MGECDLRLRVWTAAFVFLGSYLPLALILLARDFDYEKYVLRHPLILLLLCAICGLCCKVTCWLLSRARAKRSVSILHVKYVPAKLMNYTLPFVVAFMGIEYQDIGNVVGVIIFLPWIFWITYKSGQIILNPILIVLGWRLYEITFKYSGGNEDLNQGIALFRGDLEKKSYKYGRIDDVMLVKDDALA